MNNKIIILVVALVILAGGGFYSFKYFQGKAKNPLAGTTVTEEGYTVQYGMDGESATVTDPKTGAKLMTGPDLKVPGEFPKNIPVYSSGKVVMVSLDPKFPMVSIESKDDVKTVKDWYQKELPKMGWRISVDQTIMPELARMEFENPAYMGAVAFTRDTEKAATNITLTAMTREEAQKMFKDVMGGQ